MIRDKCFLVAAKSKKEAAKVFGMSVHSMNGYATVTGNKEEIELAMKTPGVKVLSPDKF